MAYATKAEFETYSGMTAPSDIDRLLKRASDLMDRATLGRIDTSDSEQFEAANNATCAQVEYWLTAGEQTDITGPVQGYTVGSFQMQFGAGKNRATAGRLAPRAKDYLFMAGLMYRGVNMS